MAPEVLVGPAAAPAASSTLPPDPLPGREARGGFLRAWPAIAPRLMGGDPDELDRLVEPSVGLYVLHNPGAVTVVMHHDSYSAAFHAVPFPVSLAPPVLGECELRTDMMPSFSCVTETYTPAGCVHTPGPPAPLTEAAQWTLPASVTDSEAERWLAPLREIDALITDAVSDTAHDTTWYFGRLRGRWWLMAVDIVTPCSA